MDLILRLGETTQNLQLPSGRYLVGRDPACAVHLPERQISARHAELRIDGDELFVRDLGSTNGTDLDGRPLKPEKRETPVPPGGILSFAGVLLERPGDPATAVLDTDRFTTHGSFTFGEDFSQAAGARIAGMLSSLFELIAAEGDDGQLEDTACEFVGRWVPADRVVMLGDFGEGTSLEKVGSWTETGDPTEEIRLSQTVIDRVTAQRTSVLLMDIQGATGGPSESMVALHLRSAMAVPLFDNHRVRGIIYVDTARPGVSYTEEELQVVTATANAVAVKLRNRSMEQELATAARIQRAMLPENLPEIPGHEVHARLDMCRAVGGDLFLVAPRTDDHLLLAVGDVAGKGTPAALAMSACMVLVSTLAEIGGQVDGIINLIHRKLWENLAMEQFITLFLADLDPATGKLTYANAGHEPPLLVRADGRLEDLGPTGPPVALLPDSLWRMEQAVLEPGDLLAVFSDGIPEATVDGVEFLGLDPLKGVLTGGPGAPLAELSAAAFAAVRAFLRGNPTSDDVTLVLLRRNG